jgi:hypothetical protein
MSVISLATGIRGDRGIGGPLQAFFSGKSADMACLTAKTCHQTPESVGSKNFEGLISQPQFRTYGSARRRSVGGLPVIYVITGPSVAPARFNPGTGGISSRCATYPCPQPLLLSAGRLRGARLGLAGATFHAARIPSIEPNRCRMAISFVRIGTASGASDSGAIAVPKYAVETNR